MGEKEVFQVIYVSDSSKIADIPVVFGQLIILDNGSTRNIYYDGDNGRIQFSGIIVMLKTDAERRALSRPPQGFYFCSDTLVLWNYGENGWNSITTPPDGQIVFDSIPQVGDVEKLYVSGRIAYRYLNGIYQQIAPTCVQALEI